MHLVEFALCIPVVIALFAAPIQLQRLWARQFALERLAVDVARALGSEPGDAARLSAVARALAGADTAVAVRVRPLAPPLLSPLRRPRTLEVVEVDLARQSGIGFPFPSAFVCRAHARELRSRGAAT